jgi:lipoprotein-releasing system permease protein
VTTFWLIRHFVGSWRRFFDLTMSLSVLGLAIGVASLVVSMAVVSGYESTLITTVQDVAGHLLVLKRGVGDPGEILGELQPHIKGFKAATPFVYVEAILAAKGQLNGVLIEGIDPETVNEVLNLKNRLVAGDLKLEYTPGEARPPILIGKGIAEKFKLNIGDEVRVVVPLSGELGENANFKPKLVKYIVHGILNYGRFDFDSRYMVLNIMAAQNLAEIGTRITGYRIRLDNPENARQVSEDILNRFGSAYWSRDWFEVNRNLFEAVKLEKTVLFFVLLILIVVACFNVSSTLYMTVVKRYRDISVLKAIGASDKFIRRLFTLLGLTVGGVGALLGIGLGLLVCLLFEWAQVHLGIIPKEVYKLDHIDLDVRTVDLVMIVIATQVICFIATLVPARRGAKVTPVEGLRYE